jgi:hypothetical protein
LASTELDLVEAVPIDDIPSEFLRSLARELVRNAAANENAFLQAFSLALKHLQAQQWCWRFGDRLVEKERRSLSFHLSICSRLVDVGATKLSSMPLR